MITKLIFSLTAEVNWPRLDAGICTTRQLGSCLGRSKHISTHIHENVFVQAETWMALSIGRIGSCLGPPDYLSCGRSETIRASPGHALILPSVSYNLTYALFIFMSILIILLYLFFWPDCFYYFFSTSFIFVLKVGNCLQDSGCIVFQ